MEVTYRLILPEDNVPLAEMIRKVFREFKIDRPGTVYTDPTTDHLYELFQVPKAEYWIAETNGEIVGGCGIYPSNGLPEGCAELVKFYVAASVRGTGIGKQLMAQCIDSARDQGYQQLYLESLPELEKAVGMYEKAGFHRLQQPVGDTGHYACTVWMLKDL